MKWLMSGIGAILRKRKNLNVVVWDVLPFSESVVETDGKSGKSTGEWLVAKVQLAGSQTQEPAAEGILGHVICTLTYL